MITLESMEICRESSYASEEIRNKLTARVRVTTENGEMTFKLTPQETAQVVAEAEAQLLLKLNNIRKEIGQSKLRIEIDHRPKLAASVEE